MSAFHRIDDVRAMPAPRFINLALRLVAYKGVVRMLIERAQHDAQTNGTPAAAPHAAMSSGDIRQNRTIPSDAATLTTDPALAGLFEQKAATDA